MEAVPDRLSAKYKGSFAYRTVKDRIPVILTKVIDTVYRHKNEVKEEHGQEGLDDLKSLVNRLSKLRNELQTDKVIVPLTDGRNDNQIWNKYLEKLTEENDDRTPSWFQDSWLYVECYMYRRITEAIFKSEFLKDLDPFLQQKQTSLTSSLEAISTLLSYLDATIENLPETSQEKLKTLFEQFIAVSLWGNKCDLSISAGNDNFQTESPLTQLLTLKPFLLIDDTESLWHEVQTGKEHSSKINIQLSDHGNFRLDIILDNAGFELVSDLCLAEFLLSSKLVGKVHLHAKDMPWFVSDTTKCDFMWTLKTLEASENVHVRKFAEVWQKRLEEGSFKLQEHEFWSLPQDYSEMNETCPDLYEELCKSDLILFKGDLNYRKLVGDRMWPHTTVYKVALQGFEPAPLCALRTLKSDNIVGLQEGQDVEPEKRDPDWMVTGEYGIIQYNGGN